MEASLLKDLVITRLIDAPLELVWNAWTSPEHVMRWWGPKDYTSPVCKIDFREGGQYLFCMRAPDYQGGQDFYSTGVYQKIVPMEKIEFTQSMCDKDGNIIDPAQMGLPPDFPKEVLLIVVFKTSGRQTEISVTECDWTPGEMADYAVAGWNQSLDKLGDSLKSG